ncbi:hypothetical protein GPECTOR_19g308 [Gonium pectorale]|uniref:TOG domain-containing protein n=1 Tax=Gonium pectorale TaxID=33097 RepID=A0A150GJ75_GONPE|nr:hypothetical protein GPECTOR_19g308 [Gonium pectorale]|eukprot:KXZ49857.1 hypothetical protein GPECTOR_19g308 [Gonium pectorale]
MHAKGVLDEKCAATAALGLYAQAAPAAFLPFMEQTLEAFTRQPGGMCRYFHEEVRVQAAEAMPRLAAAVLAAVPPPPAGTPGLAPQVRHVLDIAIKELSRALDDSDPGVTTAALQAFQLLLRQFGAESLGGPACQRLAEVVAAVFKGDAPCSAVFEDEEDEPDGDEEGGGGGDAEEELLAAATELLPAMATAAGPAAYAPVFAGSHLPALLGRLGSGNRADVRSVVVGGLAEVAEVLQSHVAPHLGSLVPPLLRELRCSEPINRQNAAFALGVLAAGCGSAALGPHLAKLLQALHPLFAATEEPGVRDNACGCVARMLTMAPAPAPPMTPAGAAAAPGGAAEVGSSAAAAAAAAAAPGSGCSLLPLEAVLPVFLGALPLREDLKEAPPVYGALCGLLTGDQAQRIASFVPGIVSAFGAAAVQQPPLPAAVVGVLARTLAALTQQYPGPMGQLVTALPAEQRAALEAAAAAAGC